VSTQKISISKPIVSISELCEMLQLSRARYYQLIKSGFFPKPLVDNRSKRPYYDADLQQKCIEAREKGIGADGSMLLFYSPRKSENSPKKRKQKIDTQVQEYADTLKGMGLEVSVKQVQAALSELYPQGTDGQDQGLIIRELFRFLKQKK
jgi:hypothetical protein